MGPTRPAPKPIDSGALDAALEAFYRAQAPQALSDAVGAARGAAPHSGRYHEVAARLAELQRKAAEMFDHQLLALADPDYDAAQILVQGLNLESLGYAQRARLDQVLRGMFIWHPDPEVRDVAGVFIARLLDEDGSQKERDERVGSLPGRLEWAIVGPFDNEQGRAWEPEAAQGLDQTYWGRSGPLAWRRSVPLDSLGRIDFAQLIWPATSQVAYAQAELTATQAGPVSLLLTSTDPVTVWLDGRVVFSDRITPDDSAMNRLVVPLTLSAGKHRLLLKSAQSEGQWKLGARVVPSTGHPPKITRARAAGQWLTEKIGPPARQQALLARWASRSITRRRDRGSGCARLPRGSPSATSPTAQAQQWHSVRPPALCSALVSEVRSPRTLRRWGVPRPTQHLKESLEAGPRWAAAQCRRSASGRCGGTPLAGRAARRRTRR